MMASGSDPDAHDAKLALLRGAELVARLCTTYRRADFEAVARVLDARDRRAAELEAELEAALADNDALREKYESLLDAHRRPRDEAEETAHLVGVAAPVRVHQDWDEPRVEEAEEGEVKGPEFVDLCSSEEEEDERAKGACKEASWVSCEKKRIRKRRRRRKRGGTGPATCADADAVKEEDEEDTETLSQRSKRLREGEPGAVESGKGNGQGQNNWVGSLGNDQHKSWSARMEGPEARTGHMVGTPEDPKVAAFVQGKEVVQREKVNREMPCRVLQETSGIREQGGNLNSIEKTGKLGGSDGRDRELQEKLVNSKLNNSPICSLRRDEEDARVPEKGGFWTQSYELGLMCGSPDGSSGACARNGVPARGVSQPPKGNGKMNNTSMVESSCKSGNKKDGADFLKCPPLLRQCEERGIAREGVPYEKTTMAALPPMSNLSLPGPDRQGYFFELGGTPPSSLIQTKTQKLQDLAKGGNVLSRELVNEELPKHREKNNDNGSEQSSSPSRVGEGAKFTAERAPNEEPRKTALLPLVSSNYSDDELKNSGSKGAKLCNLSTTKSSCEPGPSCASKGLILPPYIGKDTSIQAKGRKSSLPSTITRHWDSDRHMITSFIGNMELYMQALCALYRQKKLESTKRGKTGSIGLSQSDASRATKLAEFLLDGDLQGPLKRTAEELVNRDAAGPSLLEKVAFYCSKQLFDIYRNKEDPYFC